MEALRLQPRQRHQGHQRGVSIRLPHARTEVLADGAAVAGRTVERVLGAAREAIAERGVFHLVLAGGTTPKLAYGLLAEADQDWRRWQVWYGDERCLPVDDAERNSRMVGEAWLDRVAFPVDNQHPIAAERGAEVAAREYADAVRECVLFDMVLLGMGEDGHTASLFPGQWHDLDELVHAVHDAPKPPPDRVSLSSAVLAGAREVLMLVTGSGKREAVARWAAGESLPIAGIQPIGSALVLLDRAAAGVQERARHR